MTAARGSVTASGVSLDAHGVTWSVRGRPIVRGVDLATVPGEMTGILGPNGSGKSTLLRILTGLVRPDDGVVRLDGEDLRGIPRRRFARRVAFVEQSVVTDQNPTVREVIELGRIPHRAAWAGPRGHDDDAVTRAAATTGLGSRLDQRYATLSGGERQRVQIARALAQEPAVLVLDEPTNHLDIRHQLDLLRLVRGTGATVITALHDLNLAAAYCDRLVILESGTLVASGAPHEVLTSELIRRVYGVDAEVSRDERGVHIRYVHH